MTVDLLSDRGTPLEQQVSTCKELAGAPDTMLADDTVRIVYAREGEGALGSFPGSSDESDRGTTSDEREPMPARLERLLDKLGERLAFERTGVRLYEALISKHEAFGGFAGGPTRDELVEMLDDEHYHFVRLVELITELGGDPTAVTPSADMIGTLSMGVVQVLSDARTTVVQGLEAILLAELTDRDGWAMLVELGRDLLTDDVMAELIQAEQTEEEHLSYVREWLRQGLEAGTARAAQ